MKHQFSIADLDIGDDGESLQASGSTTSYECYTPDESTILQHHGAFNGVQKPLPTSSAKIPEHPIPKERWLGELESPGKSQSSKFQCGAKVQSRDQSKIVDEQSADSSPERPVLHSLANLLTGLRRSIIWAILGLILVFVVTDCSTPWSAVFAFWNRISSYAPEPTACLFPITVMSFCNSYSTEINRAQTKEMVDFSHTAGLFTQAAYSSLAGDAITQELDLQHDLVSTVLMGISRIYLPEPEGLHAALDDLDKNIIPAALDGLYDFFPAVRNSEILIAGESKAFITRLRQLQSKSKTGWLWMSDGSSWGASHDREFRALLRKLCDRVDSIIEPREKESVKVKMALQSMKATISTVRDQMLRNRKILLDSKIEKQDKLLGNWRYSDQLDRIDSSIEELNKTQDTVSEGVTVVAGIINFVSSIRGEMRALGAIANSADLQFGEDSIDGLILSLGYSPRTRFIAQEQLGNLTTTSINMSENNKTSANVGQPYGKAKAVGRNSRENEDDMFVLVDRKNLIVKDDKLVSSYDGPPLDDRQGSNKGKSAKKVDDGFEEVPVYGGSPNKI
ncbi:hypothetical protein F5Y14DRAFT_447821 [Nemania sp. NC0429]|nr:hypothetical protein F5Y14DRAFT_447821 [Nemania sp. NC0429]